MSLSSVITEELRGLNDNQLESVYRIIKSLKKQKVKPVEEVSLEEVWKITARSKGNWSQTVEEMREERV